ncbi:RNA 2',3'-cyclic phosphodiesterase [Tropicimonas sediminicola]|uniref:RNA 2',3'-cyclic phosphodiesterase n=1 Tax=Tropicimonas sediminicola TaxID=1031541 RepID=A0A239L1Z8_9RHOB|nr:RNA 2',3'-cyclic phosphodiesterase [Tropicimonas sediminicola]SNT24330.1 2'-5' RNA ligase [Tropicimonas sediminicola]
MRCFVAIPLPETVRDALAVLQEGLPVGRATPYDNLHLTLAFLGEVPETELLAVHEALSAVRGARFTATFEGMDLFGGRQPKILFAAVRRDEALMALHVSVRTGLAGVGLVLPRERYRPHVTLARFNRAPGRDEAARLGRYLEASALAPVPGFDAESFALFRSDLGNGPALHTELAVYPLR